MLPEVIMPTHTHNSAAKNEHFWHLHDDLEENFTYHGRIIWMGTPSLEGTLRLCNREKNYT